MGRRALRSGIRVAVRTLLAAGLVIALAEGTLQVLALFARSRSSAWKPGTTRHVLCVGDSHTYGIGVDANDSYPGQLQRFLDEAAPGVYSVMNQGIPGMSATQIVNRLPAHLGDVRPEVVVVEAGLNDSWNEAEVGVARSWLGAVLAWSRLYRLGRVVLHGRSLDREGAAGGLHDPRPVVDTVGDPFARNRTSTVDWGDDVERMEFKERSVGMQPDAEVEARLVQDYEAIVQSTQAAGARLVFVTYLLDFPHMALPNRTMRAVAERHDVRVVDTSVSLSRVPPDDRVWIWGLHPGAATYREIARDVAAAILRLDTGTP